MTVEAPRRGSPWTPEEDLFVLVERPTPARAVEAFEALRQLREAALSVVNLHASGWDSKAAFAKLEQALLLGSKAE